MTVYAGDDLSVVPMFSYDLIAADPPWPFENYSAKGEKKSARLHYDTMSMDQIAALRVGDLLTKHGWFALWTTAPALNLQIRIMEDAWGIRYVTHLVWAKRTNSGKLTMGPGYVARTRHELILIGKVGKPPRARAIDSLFDGVRREHSRKPEEFYRHMERFMPNARRLDLFSRQPRDGWDSWGREARKFPDADKEVVAEKEDHRLSVQGG